MAVVQHDRLQRLLYGEDGGQRRFTQDSPILPEVWFTFNQGPAQRRRLLLTPFAPRRASELAGALRRRLRLIGAPVARTRVAYTNTYVAADLTFRETIQAALPLSPWWQRTFGEHDAVALTTRVLARQRVPRERTEGDEDDERDEAVAWLGRLVGAIVRTGDRNPALERALLHAQRHPEDERLLYAVTLNRPARLSLRRSRAAVKADAAHRVFEPVCSHLRWAVVDSGIDATHPAFQRANGPGTPATSRVWQTYDFTSVRGVLTPPPEATAQRDTPPSLLEDDPEQELHDRLQRGRAVDWDLVARRLRMEHEPGAYQAPRDEHGTHVAGILAGDWRGTAQREDLVGVCPDLELLDLRVFDGEGRSDEFQILGALQFVRHLNARSELPVVHGVNLSFSLDHDVENYACGRTPVCEEVERLVASGVVVVAAAGNQGWSRFFDTAGSPYDGYRAISITDPGNAHGAITVGSTHRHQPHVYGVSYFSSRGPTGDGRHKPDVVAPGEKITAPIPGSRRRAKDGTSMAAPHVSGAAALLMARHDELVGDPAAIKRIICETATDLGRERYFQGAGMLDVLRALQAH